MDQVGEPLPPVAVYISATVVPGFASDTGEDNVRTGAMTYNETLFVRPL